VHLCGSLEPKSALHWGILLRVSHRHHPGSCVHLRGSLEPKSALHWGILLRVSHRHHPGSCVHLRGSLEPKSALHWRMGWLGNYMFHNAGTPFGRIPHASQTSHSRHGQSACMHSLIYKGPQWHHTKHPESNVLKAPKSIVTCCTPPVHLWKRILFSLFSLKLILY
jgi:hypothetical protein